MKHAKHQFLRLYCQKLLKYLLLYICLLVLIIPIFIQAYVMAKNLTINSFEVKLSEGVNQLEAQILRAVEVSNALKAEETFRSLLLLQGKPDSSDYQDFKNLQTKLSVWAMTTNMVTDAYIMFRNNPLLLTNSLSADTYDSAYPRFIQYGDLSADAWRDLLFHGIEELKFLPETPITSHHRTPSNYMGVTLVIDNSSAAAQVSNSVSVFTFNKDKIVEALLEVKNRALCELTVKTRAGDVLLVNRPCQDVEAASANDVNLQCTSNVGLVTAELHIPKSYFSENVKSIILTLVLYGIGGTCLLLVLTLGFMIHEGRKARQLVESAARRSGLHYDNRNEFSFASEALDSLYHTSEQRLEQIGALNLKMRSAALESLLLYGITSTLAPSEAAAYAELAGRYRVIKAEILAENTERFFLALDEVLRRLHPECMRMIFEANQMTCIMPQSDACPVDELAKQLSCFAQETVAGGASGVRIGLSKECHGAEYASQAHQQAKNAMNMCSAEEMIFVYRDANKSGKKALTPTMQAQLYDALLSGDAFVIKRIFVTFSSLDVANQRKAMLFFAISLTVDNAMKELLSSNLLDESCKDLLLPVYDEGKSAVLLFEEMRSFCLKMCDYRIDGKKEKSSKQARRMMEYIEQNFQKATLSSESIAEELRVSPNTVFSAIRKETGKSLSQYIEDVRLAHVEQLLLKTDLSVSEIWEASGFGSEKTFYRAFAKKYAQSPVSWKNKNRN